MKRIINSRDKSIEFLSRRSGADTVGNVAMVEFRFGALVLIEKLLLNVAYKKTGVAGSHLVPMATPLIYL